MKDQWTTPPRDRSWRAVLVALVSAALALGGVLTAPAALAATGVLSHVGSEATGGNRTTHSVALPSGLEVGDLLVLTWVGNTTASEVTQPAGWTLLEQADGDGTRSLAWSRTAQAADIDNLVSVTTPAFVKSVMSVTAYRSTLGTPTVTASALTTVDAPATDHTVPSVALEAGSWVVDQWVGKNTDAMVWTLPAGVVSRATAEATGTGGLSSVLTDSDGPVGAASSDALVATTDIAVSRGVQMAFAVSPGDDENVPPVASFTTDCTDLECSFDASATTDADGDALTYSWDFGDGATGTGVTTSHTYANQSARTVVLTVDDGTTTGTATDLVVVGDVTVGEVSFVGAASSAGSGTAVAVDVPAGVEAGDVLVLALTVNSDTPTVTPPAGWTELADVAGGGTRGLAWTTTAEAGDAGAAVEVTTSAAVRSVLSVAAYRSTIGTPSVSASEAAVTRGTARSHTAPAVALAGSASWLVSVWAEESSRPNTWTVPSTERTQDQAAGGGKVSQVLADSDGPVAGPTSAALVAETSTPTGQVVGMSFAVTPGSGPGANTAPQADLGVSCTDLDCSFDASASSDADGDSLTFAWDFGDGETGTGETVDHSYLTGGPRTVTLTVDDGVTTDVATEEVVPSVTPVAPGHTAEVVDQVLTDMPRITTGEIFDLERIGHIVYIAGSFTGIQNATSEDTTSYAQSYLAAFDLETGLVLDSFLPDIDAAVQDVEASPDGTKLYIAGRFNVVDGETKRRFASIDPLTGAPVMGFTASANGAGSELEATNDTVYLGGQFTTINGEAHVGLAAVDADTGALVGSTGLNPGGTWYNDLSGGIGPDGAINVQELKLTPDESTLLVVHTARQVDAQTRYGVALIDTASGDLLPWRTRLWEDNLAFVGGVQRAYAADISPDGTYMVVTSGSGGDRPPLNDTAIRFPLAGGDFVEPEWVSRHFDSVYSVAISEAAIYVGGHFSWQESPTARDPWPGLDDVGYGTGQGLSGYALGDEVVRRDHVGSLDPELGKAMTWDPGSNSFEGNKAMLVTPWGLVTGGDATTQGAYNVGDLAVYPLPSSTPSEYETTITTPIPGRVVATGEEFTIEGTGTATSGVQRVQIEVYDRDSRQYLQDDLVTWAGTFNGIDATLDSPAATSTTWSLPLTIADSRALLLRAKTFAVNGSSDSTKAERRIETFSYDDIPPTASVTGPSSPVLSRTFLVTGTATDDFGVVSIGYTLRDSNNRYLQDDGTATATYNSFSILPDVVGGLNTTWSVEVTVPYDDTWQIQVTPRDTAGQPALDTRDRTWIVSETGIRPWVTITDPAPMTPPVAVNPVELAPGSPVTFSGTAQDDEGLAYVEVRLSNLTSGEALDDDGTWAQGVRGWYRVTLIDLPGTSVSWSYTTPFDLTSGTYSFQVRAVDDIGLSTATADRGNLTLDVQIPGDSPPDTTLTAFDPPTVLHVDLAGTATDDLGVDDVQVRLYDYDTRRYLQPDGTMSGTYATVPAVLASPGATSTDWSLSVDLPTEGDWGVTALSFDNAGQQDASSVGATARFQVYPGDAPPTLTEALQTPTSGSTFTEGRIVITGRVEDDQSSADVEIAVVNDLGQYMTSTGAFLSTSETWRSAFLTSPGSPGSNFAYTTPVIPPGVYTVYVRGVDQHDLVTDPPLEITDITVEHPPNDPPVAAFTVTCGAALGGTPTPTDNVCEFDGRTSTDENTAALSYAWDSGQGTGTGAVYRKTYTAPGTYTVELTVTDEFGATATATQDVTITEPPTNQAPTAVISTPFCSGLTCNFSSAASSDPDLGDAITRVWSWGDASADSTSTSPSHAFPAAGTYTVTLVVSDGWGQSDTATLDVTVTDP